VALVPEAADAAVRMPEVCDGLLITSAALARNYRVLADALVGQGRAEMATETPKVGGPIDRTVPEATMTLLELEAWLAELSVEIERTRPALEELGLITPSRPVRTTSSVHE
jgi:hypothetical protein